jgi:hypothetical protein
MVDIENLMLIIGMVVTCLILGGMIGYDMGRDHTMKKVYQMLENLKKEKEFNNGD